MQTLEEMARMWGGKVVVNDDHSPGRKILWECSEGHRWDQQPEIIMRGDWCPFCERRNRAKKLDQDEFEIIKVPRLFHGNKFELFSFDMNNLMTGYLKKFPDRDILQSDFTEKIKNLLPTMGNCLSYFFVSKYYDYIKSKLPENQQNRWFIEVYPKPGLKEEIMDIDPTLTGRIAPIIENYHTKITNFYLGSGDLDLHIVIDLCNMYKIPVTIIALDNESVNNTLRTLSDSVKILYQ